MQCLAETYSFKRGNIRRRELACVLVLSVVLMTPAELLGAEQPAEPGLQTETAPQTVESQDQSVPAKPDAGGQAGAVPAPEPLLPKLLDTADNLLGTEDATRNYWSAKFEGYANDIDHFFGDPRYFKETNNSVLQINFIQVQQPGGGKLFGLSEQAKMDLPSTEKRFKLMVESNPERNVSTDTAQVTPVTTNDIATNNITSAALRYEKEKLQERPWHFSADMGVEARVPPQPFVRTRGSYSVPMEKWRMKTAETLFWFSSIGAGETTQVDLERFISEPVMFRATTAATWMNDTHNFDLRQDFSLYQTLDERAALLYQATITGVSEPRLATTEYVFLLLYRYRLHRKWAFLELSPQLHFARDKDFRLDPMLVLRLEILFDNSR